MREYGKVGPKFWQGETGKAIKREGMEAVIVAMYLMSSPHSNMLGLYFQPVIYLAHETGLGLEGAQKGLAGVLKARFCEYDEESEVVWVLEMAKYQISEQLKAGDNAVKGIQNLYEQLPKNPFLTRFYMRYSAAFHMTTCRPPSGLPATPLQAPSEPLGSQRAENREQEQEQEQEQAQEQDVSRKPAVGGSAAAKPASKRAAPTPNPEASAAASATFLAYSQAYEQRYGAPPVRNARLNTNISQLVKLLGYVESPEVAGFFLTHNNALYVRAGHATELLVRDANKLRTEWFTGRKVTATQAQQADRTQSNGDVFGNLLDRALAEEAGRG